MRCSARGLCSLGFTALLVASLASMPTIITGQTSDALTPVAPLKDQLEKGLRARRDVEFQFVRRVAQLVDQGQLSKELVQGCFSWTLKRYRLRTKTLVPYFEQVLRLRAKQAGITALNNVPTTLPKIQGT